MSLVHSVGKITGSVGSSIQYPLTVWDDGFATIETADAIAYALTVAPATVFGLLPVATNPSVEEVARHIVRVVIEYTPAELTPPTPPPVHETGALVRRASFQAKGKYVYTAIEPIAAYDAEDGDVTDDWPRSLWCVNIQGKGFESSRVVGLQVEPLPEAFSLDFFAPNAVITKTYLDNIAAICGHFNSATWNGYPQGSLQLVRFSLAERSANDWDVGFGLGYAPPQTDVQVGPGITLPELRGSWIYTTRQREVFESATNITHVEPYLAFVQRVWDESDFSVFDLPAMT